MGRELGIAIGAALEENMFASDGVQIGEQDLGEILERDSQLGTMGPTAITLELGLAAAVTTAQEWTWSVSIYTLPERARVCSAATDELASTRHFAKSSYNAAVYTCTNMCARKRSRRAGMRLRRVQAPVHKVHVRS